jgi:hypothetical protein
VKRVTRCVQGGRETWIGLHALPSGSVKQPRWFASCSSGPECATFTAGRRAGLKEALKLVRDWWVKSEPPMGLEIFDRLREAMKPARAKA